MSSSPQKRQGTSWERDLESQAHDHGLLAWRLAEHGQHDLGDLVVVTADGDHIILEAKCRQALPAHTAVAKAKVKARHPSAEFLPLTAVVVWKRLQATSVDRRRRQPAPPVVVMDLDDFWTLIGGRP